MEDQKISFLIQIIERSGKMITRKDLEKNIEFQRILGKLKEIKGIRKIILIGSLAKKGRTNKDIDLLLVSERINEKEFEDFQSKLFFENVSGSLHITNIANYSNFEHLIVPFSKGYYPIDIWLTDIEHLNLALKHFGIKKPKEM